MATGIQPAKGVERGRVMAFRDFVITADAPKPPCGPHCERRTWDCHFAGRCAEYDAYCAVMRSKQRVRVEEHKVNDYVDARIRQSIKKGRRRNG